MSKNISKLFHEQTSFSFEEGAAPENSKCWLEEGKQIACKSYPRMSKIVLPTAFLDIGSFERALVGRSSTRSFDPNKEVTLEQLSTLLHFSAGIRSPQADTNATRRFYPSGGARYPLEIYLGIQNVAGVQKGIYHYNILEHCLENIGGTEYLADLQASMVYPWSKDASVFFIITAVWDRNPIKYNDCEYRMILLEAGHLMQNLVLAASALGVGSCNLGGFDNERIDKTLDITHSDESSMYVTALGVQKHP